MKIEEIKMLEQIKREAAEAAKELCEVAKLKRGQIVVVGCSSSEIGGGKIGTASSPEIAEALCDGLFSAFDEYGVYIAAQCCEHLNRAIVIEREAVPHADFVNVVPQPKAGGSFATECYRRFREPVVLESVRADAGMDIGDTLIGMHLKTVAVPVRLSVKTIGNAHLTFARTRPKFIGGVRAVYNEELL